MDKEKLKLELQRALDKRELWLEVAIKSTEYENFRDAKRFYEYWNIAVKQLKELLNDYSRI